MYGNIKFIDSLENLNEGKSILDWSKVEQHDFKLKEVQPVGNSDSKETWEKEKVKTTYTEEVKLLTNKAYIDGLGNAIHTGDNYNMPSYSTIEKKFEEWFEQNRKK